MEDLTGRVFGGLKVLEPDKEKEGFWLCHCGCGQDVSISAEDLLSGARHSCGCGRKRLHCGDITGMRSGRLVAVRPTDQKRRSSTLWLCKCDCGGEILAEPYKIRNKVISSCGCIRTEKKIKDITGQRFGRLVALERLDRKRGSSFLWRCQCDCGKIVETSANSLLSGNTRSCGCLRIEAIRRTNAMHGSVSRRMRLVDGTCVDSLERSGLQKNNTSGCTGVQARGDKWIAVLTFKKEVHYLGIFDKKEDAIRVRKDAERRYFDAFLKQYYDENAGEKEAQPKEQPAAEPTEKKD
jgi:hypothetical protein